MASCPEYSVQFGAFTTPGPISPPPFFFTVALDLFVPCGIADYAWELKIVSHFRRGIEVFYRAFQLLSMQVLNTSQL